MVSVNEEYFNILKDQGNLQKIQNVIDESGGEAVFRFEEYLWKAVNGEINLNLESILEMLGNIAFSGLNSGMDELIRIMGIALIAAVFTNFSFSSKDINLFIRGNVKELYGDDYKYSYVLKRTNKVNLIDETDELEIFRE